MDIGRDYSIVRSIEPRPEQKGVHAGVQASPRPEDQCIRRPIVAAKVPYQTEPVVDLSANGCVPPVKVCPFQRIRSQEGVSPKYLGGTALRHGRSRHKEEKNRG